MNNYVRNVSLFLMGGAFVILILSLGAFREPSKDKFSNSPSGNIPVLPDTLNFAGETVPLNRWDVKERMDRELLFNFYNKPHVLNILKLSNRYFPVISERLKANGVPDDFKYLCVAESSLEPSAISRSGAVSFWQFMNNTAPGYNLAVNPQIDQRYDLERATDAACKYLKLAYSRFGSWTAAAASYNCGMGGYNSRAVFQKTRNYYDLYLPEETNRYMFRILTFKHLMTNADALGFQLTEEEKYKPLPFKTISITSSVPDLAVFAIDHGTTYKILKLMNPWILGRSLTVSAAKPVTIKLPV